MGSWIHPNPKLRRCRHQCQKKSIVPSPSWYLCYLISGRLLFGPRIRYNSSTLCSGLGRHLHPSHRWKRFEAPASWHSWLIEDILCSETPGWSLPLFTEGPGSSSFLPRIPKPFRATRESDVLQNIVPQASSKSYIGSEGDVVLEPISLVCRRKPASSWLEIRIQSKASATLLVFVGGHRVRFVQNRPHGHPLRQVLPVGRYPRFRPVTR